MTIGTQWLTALLFPLYLLPPHILLLAGVVALLSAVMTVYGVIQFGYRLSLIPDELQGRVNSVFRLIVFGGDPLGLALTGLLLQAFGVVPTVLFFGACLVVLALATMLNRYIRHAPQLVSHRE